MDQEYLKDCMCEELDGAKEYIQRAIEIKAMDASWGKRFYEMSTQELNHAQYFFDMSKDYYEKVTSAFKEPPEYMEDCMDESVRIFTERYAQIKIMQGMYNN